MRIVAGQYKGRRLLPPPGRTTRPITDRAKVSLFGILAPRLAGALVADLFCGTGSLGLEALSRGCEHCWFADRDHSAIDRLRRNIAAVGAEEKATVWRGDIQRRLSGWVTGLPGRLDVVFLDPPYEMARQWLSDPSGGAPEAIGALLAAAMAVDGIVVLRTPKALAVGEAFGPLALKRRKLSGSMALNFFAPG